MSIPLSGSTPKPFLHKHSGFSSLTRPLPYPIRLLTASRRVPASQTGTLREVNGM
jgi:hypothetical protein